MFCRLMLIANEFALRGESVACCVVRRAVYVVWRHRVGYEDVMCGLTNTTGAQGKHGILVCVGECCDSCICCVHSGHANTVGDVGL